MDISEMIIKRDATWFVEYWLFKTSGEYIGIIRPSIPWYTYPFGIFSNLFGLLIPIAFHILDSDNNLIGNFRTSGPKIKTVVKIYDNQNELIGIYRQYEWRDLFNIRGELFFCYSERGGEVLKRIMGMFFGWETIYMTNNLQEFSTIRGRLLDSGIRMKTKTGGSGLMVRGRGHSGLPIQPRSSTTYEILVRKEDLHKATEAIHRLR